MAASDKSRLYRNPNETYQANIIVCAVLTWVIGAGFVGVRFYTRCRLLHNGLGAEDWTILAALVFAGATCAGMIEQAVYGLGKHMLDVDPAFMIPMARAGWYTILWYMLSLLFTKISILLLYIRILSYQHARYAVYAILAIVIVANGLWTFITVMTACVPLHAFWDRTIPGSQCRPLVYWYANTGLHIATDVLLYVLPLPVIVNLQVKLRQKVVLYGVFALGFFVCSISVVRLWDLVEESKRTDFTYDNVSISYLTVIEINAAIACACCMTLKPFCARFFPRLWGSRSVGSGAHMHDVERGARRGGGGGGGLLHGTAGQGQVSPAGGRLGLGRGPPTIGSKPSRGMQDRRPLSWATCTTVTLHDRDRCGSGDTQLFEGSDATSIGSDEKKGFRAESPPVEDVTPTTKPKPIHVRGPDPTPHANDDGDVEPGNEVR